jgi:glyoxylase-like metal-dependent hydrolase (beta-lactamase superfamily II)
MPVLPPRPLGAVAAAAAALCLTAVAPPPARLAQDDLSLASARRARAVLAAGIDAMGGLAALQRVETVTRELAGTRSDEGQGLRPHEGAGAPPVTAHPRVLSVRDLKRGRAADALTATILGGQPLVRRTFVNGAAGATVFYDYIWQAARPLPPPSVPNVRASLLDRYPEGLLLGAWQRPEALRWAGEATHEGRAQRVISYATPDGALVALWFDAATRLLTKRETVGDDAQRGDVTREIVYDDWRPVGGGPIRLPYRTREIHGGSLLEELRASSIRLDEPLPDSLFAIPPSFATLGAPAPAATTALGEDVYLVSEAYQSVFVVFDDHVVVLEPGGSPRTARTTIEAVRRAAPGKPIRYVVATHFHWDHIGGIRPYVAEGATIVTTAGARRAIEQALAAPRTLRPDSLSRAPRAPTFEIVGEGGRVFRDARHELRIYRMAPTPHVAEMLFAYLPKERVLFEADALDIEEPGRVGTAGDDTALLARTIDSLRLDVARIVPVHGKPGTMADLRQALARRAARTAGR